MATHIRSAATGLLLAVAVLAMADARPARAASPQGIDPDVDTALSALSRSAPAAKSLTTTTGCDDVYAFIFGQKGLMAGLGLQGSKISRIGQ